MSLVPNYENSSSSDEESEPSDESQNALETSKEQTNDTNIDYFSINVTSADVEDNNACDKLKEKLPSASTSNSEELLPTPLFGRENLGSSVFNNRYQQAENIKLSALERHVKLSEITPQPVNNAAAKRNICHNFRKGRCQFGKKCKYSHGNESVITTNNTAAVPNNMLANFSMSGSHEELSDSVILENRQNFNEDDDSYMAEAKKRKRAGISETLIPPKKSLSALKQQRKQDSPWTLQSKR